MSADVFVGDLKDEPGVYERLQRSCYHWEWVYTRFDPVKLSCHPERSVSEVEGSPT